MKSLTNFSSLQRTTCSHTFITAELSATGRRSFMDDMTGRFGIGTRSRRSCSLPGSWNSICGETRTKYNAKSVSKLFSACLKYSWCNMLTGPVALLGFTCWNTRRTSSSFALSLWKSSSSADALFKISWICLCFCKKSWQSKRLKARTEGTFHYEPTQSEWIAGITLQIHTLQTWLDIGTTTF